MARHLYLLILTLLTAANTLAQSSCTSANARAIDADLTFLAYWEIIEVSWLAIADVKKRSLLTSSSSLSKRDLVCTASEECLSFKGDAFCYNKSAHTFHAGDGTTGNFLTGEYTLADGRVGNMYHGPYPTNTKAVAAATQTQSSGSEPTATVASTASTPIVSSSNPPATTPQQGAGSSNAATPVGSSATPKPNGSTVLRSDARWITPNSWSTMYISIISFFLGFLLCG
ncbi:hypothetical protein NA56DRAFT_685743 [Hyaloscypha hepaticicola]|uniref:Uncharacterized protein n=1 Tax=Hyaloscypha hepaticicola TaxID=2082293 RepID=A0A2J6QI19_9HELO|nr:hypothetical protein NA56DRAFT_685743 [Hyaloscypha hepaticicola]